MSDETYIKVLKYSGKRTLVGLQLFYLVVAVAFTVLITLTLSRIVQDSGIDDVGVSTLLLLQYLYILVTLLMLAEYLLSLGIFYNYKTRVVAIIYFLAISLSFVFSILIIPYADVLNIEIMSALYFLAIMSSSTIASYFLWISFKPDEEADLMMKFQELKDQLRNLSVADLKIAEALDKANRWIINKQRGDGTWGDQMPLYETSEVGRMFLLTNRGLNYSWIKVVDGVEEKRSLEQVYYLVLDALETAMISDSYQSLVPLLFVLTVDNKNVSFDDIALLEIKAKLANFSEWDFVNSLENKETIMTNEVPSIVALGPIFKYLGDYEGAQLIADIMANTFNIIVNRSIKRFSNIQDDTEIPSYFIGLLYNSLVEMLERKPYSEAPELYGEGDQDFPALALGFGQSDRRITVETRLKKMREYLESKQGIDGGWEGSIGATAECLRAIVHQEPIEREVVKLAVFFLLAQQRADGSWNEDIVLTCQAINALHAVKSNIIIAK